MGGYKRFVFSTMCVWLGGWKSGKIENKYKFPLFDWDEKWEEGKGSYMSVLLCPYHIRSNFFY